LIDRAIQSFTKGMLTAATDTIPQTSFFQKRFSPWGNKQCAIAIKNKNTLLIN